MTKKKTIKTNTSNQREDDIIVLNNEEIKILEEGTPEDIVIDTRCLDEELNVSDIFKENNIGILDIGKKGKKNKKSKDVDEKDEDNEEDGNDIEVTVDDEDDDIDLSKIVETFTMILKDKEYEPIPYPFDKDDENMVNRIFELAVSELNHIDISKFCKKNPTCTLKDAFNHIFTESEKETMSTAESIINEAFNLDDMVREKFNDIIETLANLEDDSPENINKVLIEECRKISETKEGEIIEKLTDMTIEDIIRASINCEFTEDKLADTINQKLKTILTEENREDIEKLNTISSVDELLDTIIRLLNKSNYNEECTGVSEAVYMQYTENFNNVKKFYETFDVDEF